jgi:membrane dipeptidase
VPAQIGDVAGLANLRDAMVKRGFTGDVLRKLCHENWIGVLERTWGE